MADTRITLGAVHRTSGGSTVRVTRIVNHPQHNANTLANDVSLLETATAVSFNPSVAPAELGSDFVGGGQNVVATGWGQTSHPGSAAVNLQFLTLSTLTNADVIVKPMQLVFLTTQFARSQDLVKGENFTELILIGII